MFLRLARTRIPVPEVYLYCSTPHNSVGAEWFLMEYMPGCHLGAYDVANEVDTPPLNAALTLYWYPKRPINQELNNF